MGTRKYQECIVGFICLKERNIVLLVTCSAELLKDYINYTQIFLQVLQCTDSPKFVVEWLVWNITKTHLAVWGQLGVTVVELPQKWGKFAEFQGGKDNVSCK